MSGDLYTEPEVMVPPWLNTKTAVAEIPRLIGLAGYARAGKDTTAEVITSLYGHERGSFAAALKCLLWEINPQVGDSNVRDLVLANDGWEGAKNTHEIRRLLQELGTGVRNYVHPDAWVNAAFLDKKPDDLLVFSDVRFPNEADAITARGGVVLWVSRPGVGPINSHVSEGALDGFAFDGQIHNNGSVDDLREHVREVIDAL